MRRWLGVLSAWLAPRPAAASPTPARATGAAGEGKIQAQKQDRGAALPDEMQGRWRALEEHDIEVVVSGGEVVAFGRVVDYDTKTIERGDGAVVVTLEVGDPEQEDAFARENITGLVITPEGEFHVYNVKFSMQLERT